MCNERDYSSVRSRPRSGPPVVLRLKSSVETGFFVVPKKPNHEVPVSEMLPVRLQAKEPMDALKEAQQRKLRGFLCWITAEV